MRVLLSLALAGGVVLGQTQPEGATTALARGSISGIVRVAGTGEPLANADVVASRTGAKPSTAKTDSEGRYTLRSLEAGSYQVGATVIAGDGAGMPSSARRYALLQPDQELAGFDILIRVPGQITGKVIDDNGEPVAGASVRLVAREYSYGALRYVLASAGTSDDQGKYTVGRVTPGRAFLLLATKEQRSLPAISNMPDDPSLRRPVPVPTYYPNSATPEGGELLTLRVGERREGVDVRMRKASSYCIEALVSGPGTLADLRFTIAPRRPTSGPSGDGAMYMAMPGGKLGADGKLRICELGPGDYDLEVSHWRPSEGPDYLGVANVTISDRDITGVRVAALPMIAVPGEVVWDGAAPEAPLELPLSISLRSVTRTIYPEAKSQIPGRFSFDGLAIDEYSVSFRGLQGRMYVKDLTYGGPSILRQALRVGGAPADATLRVLLARDGATITAKVADDDGKPVGNCNVVLIPADAGSEAELAASMQTGATNQVGSWTLATLAPGKYFALASRVAFDRSPETIVKLWQARTRAKEVEVTPNGSATVSLEVRDLQ